MTFRKDVMEASAKNGFTNATDAADYLVNHGVPFRDAHGIIGQLVLLCINENKALDDLTLDSSSPSVRYSRKIFTMRSP